MMSSLYHRSVFHLKSVAALAMAIVSFTILPGCNRAFFREQADDDVASLIAEKADDLDITPLGVDVGNFSITPHPTMVCGVSICR